MFKKILAYLIVLSIFYSDFSFVYSMYPDQTDERSLPVHQKIDPYQAPSLSSPVPPQNNQQKLKPTLPLAELPLTEPARLPEIPMLSKTTSSGDTQHSSSPPSPGGSHGESPGHSSPEHSTSSGSPRSGADTEQEDQGLERASSPSSSPELQELIQVNPVEGAIQAINPALPSQGTQNVIENSSNTRPPVKKEKQILLVEDKGKKGKSGSQPGEKTPLLGDRKSSSQTKLKENEDDVSLLTSSDAPAASSPKQSFVFVILEEIADFIKSKTNTKKDLQKTPVVASSSPFLPDNQGESDSEASDGTPSGKALRQQNPSINQTPDHGSSKELDDLSVDGNSWTILTFVPPKLIPDFYKNTIDIIQDMDKGLSLPPSESSPLLNANDNDPEKGKTPPSFWDKFPGKAKAQLLRIKLQDLKGELTWPQKGAIVVGLIIGGGTAYALVPVWRGGILYLWERYNGKFIDFLTGNKNITYYICISSVFDAVPRNIKLIKQAVTYVAEESVKVGRIILTGLASFLPSLLEPAYLVIAETHILKLINKHNLDNQYGETMLVLSPFLFLDSWTANFDLTWEMWDDLKEWSGKSSSPVARFLSHHFLHTSRLSPEELLRQDFHKKLNNFKHVLFKMPEKQLNQVYDNVFNSQDTIQEMLPNLDKDDLDTAQSFLVLRYLLDAGNQLEEAQKRVRTWYDTLADTINYVDLALGSFARLLTLVMVVQSLFDFFTPKNVNEGLGWGFGVVGFPIQTGLEHMAIKKFFYDFLYHEEPHGHGSHPAARVVAKVVAAIQGLVFTAPLIVLCIQVCNEWFTANPDDFWHNPSKITNYEGYYTFITSSIFFVLSEAMNLTTQFNTTYNRQIVTSLTNFYNWVRKKIWKLGPRTDDKRDELIRFIEQEQNRIKSLNPLILNQLQFGLQGDGGVAH